MGRQRFSAVSAKVAERLVAAVCDRRIPVRINMRRRSQSAATGLLQRFLFGIPIYREGFLLRLGLPALPRSAIGRPTRLSLSGWSYERICRHRSAWIERRRLSRSGAAGVLCACGRRSARATPPGGIPVLLATRDENCNRREYDCATRHGPCGFHIVDLLASLSICESTAPVRLPSSAGNP
jgi:hypothetical protein